MILDANTITYADVPEWQKRLGIVTADAITSVIERIVVIENLVARVASLESQLAEIKAYWSRIPIYGDNGAMYFLRVEVVDGVATFSDPILAEGFTEITPVYPGGTYQVIIYGKDDGLPYLITSTLQDGVAVLDVQRATPSRVGLQVWNQSAQKFYKITVNTGGAAPAYEATQSA